MVSVKGFFMVPVLVSALVLSACVTETTGSRYTDKADKQKAIDVSVQLARNYLGQQNWEAAQRHLKTALEIDDSNGEVHEGLALVSQRTGDLELAEKHYLKALRYSEESSRIRMNYAAFLYSEKRYEEAEEELEEVVEDTLYEKRPLAFLNLGRARVKLEDYAGAEEAYRRALLMDNDNPQALFELAEVHYMRGDYPKSQILYDRYHPMVRRQSARALWLGIRLADKFEDDNAFSSYSLALKNLYPKSQEYLDYKEQFGQPDE